MLRAIVPYLIYAYVTFVGWTTRSRVVGDDIPRKMRADNKRFVYAFWHQRQVYFTWSHRDANITVLVSRSKDGEIIAKTMELSHIEPIRGSSTRGGAAATRELMESFQSGREIGLTPDGPKGPARQVKGGILFLAQKMGATIIPITNALSNKLEIAKAWDRFQVPLPFGRAVIVCGQPIEISPNDDLDAKATELKAALDAITTEADRLVA